MREMMGLMTDAAKPYNCKERSSRRASCSGDRFIGLRSNLHMGVDVHHYERIADEQSQTDVLFQDLQKEPKDAYKKRLRTILNIPEPYESILKVISGQPFCEPQVCHWPVKARKYSYMSKPQLALDMPQFSSDLNINTLDWGKAGLVSSLDSTIFIWNGTKRVRNIRTFDQQSNTELCSTALKWDNTGKFLAVGTKNSHIQIWDAETLKLLEVTQCCSSFNRGCVITALAWHPMDNTLLSGCSKGVLRACVIPGIALAVIAIPKTLPSINSIQFSSDGKMVAITSFSGILEVSTWCPFVTSAMFPAIATNRAYAWHPWDPSLLVVGGFTGRGDIHIWNTKKHKFTATYRSKYPSKVVALTWSPVTAELVVSMIATHDLYGPVVRWAPKILVLANLNKAVDRLNMDGTNCLTPYLLWSPDGRDIVTASSDETLRIWNFLDVDKRRRPLAEHKGSLKIPKAYGRSNFFEHFNISCVIR